MSAHIFNVGPRQEDFTAREQAVMLVYFLAERGWPPWAKGPDGDLRVIMMATGMTHGELAEVIQSLHTKGMMDFQQRTRFA